MNSKLRHRPTPAPKGHLPDWALVAAIVSAMLLISLARSII